MKKLLLLLLLLPFFAHGLYRGDKISEKTIVGR